MFRPHRPLRGDCLSAVSQRAPPETGVTDSARSGAAVAATIQQSEAGGVSASAEDEGVLPPWVMWYLAILR